MNNRAKMRRSNQKAIEFLLQNGFDAVYIIPHTRYDSFTYLKNTKIRSKDILGIADGIAIRNGVVYMIQVKSNSFDGFNKFLSIIRGFNLYGLFLNVKNRNMVRVKEVNPIKIFEW